MHLALGGLPGVFGSPRRPCSSRGWAGPSGASPPCESVQKLLVGGYGESGPHRLRLIAPPHAYRRRDGCRDNRIQGQPALNTVFLNMPLA